MARNGRGMVAKAGRWRWVDFDIALPCYKPRQCLEHLQPAAQNGRRSALGMKRGFTPPASAQFFQLAGRQRLVRSRRKLLRSTVPKNGSRRHWCPRLPLFYVVPAFVGAFADSQPKGRVMLLSNTIKIVGCLMMLFGTHPLMAYATGSVLPLRISLPSTASSPNCFPACNWSKPMAGLRTDHCLH